MTAGHLESDPHTSNPRDLAEQLLKQAAVSRLAVPGSGTAIDASILRFLDPAIPSNLTSRHLAEASRTLSVRDRTVGGRLLNWLVRLGDEQRRGPVITIGQPFMLISRRLSGQTPGDGASLEIASHAYTGRLMIDGEAHYYGMDNRVISVSVQPTTAANNVHRARYLLAPGSDEPKAFYSAGVKAGYPLVNPELRAGENMLRLLAAGREMMQVSGLKTS